MAECVFIMIQNKSSSEENFDDAEKRGENCRSGVFAWVGKRELVMTFES